MSDKVTWLDHTFSVHTPNIKFKDIPGIYIFCSVNQANEWVPLYIGQASSLAERLSTHERWKEAVSLGATNIHAKAVQVQSSRDQIEEDLIQSYQPRLNTQLK